MPCFWYPLGGSYFHGEPATEEDKKCGRPQEMWTRPTRAFSSGQVRSDIHSPFCPRPPFLLLVCYTDPTPLRQQCNGFLTLNCESTKPTRELVTNAKKLWFFLLETTYKGFFRLAVLSPYKCEFIYSPEWPATPNLHNYLVILNLAIDLLLIR